MGEVVVYRKRRGVELVMLLLAMAIAVAGYLLTDLNSTGELPDGWAWGAAAYVAIGLGAHLLIRWRLPYADPLLLPLVYLLNGLGLAMIHRLDLGTTPVMHSAELQLTWTAIAVAVFGAVVILLRDHRRLQRFPYLMFLAGIAIVMSPIVPGLGLEKHGARIWIHLGPYSFQPAELAKIVLSIAFAAYLVEKKEVLALAGARVAGIDLPRPRDLGPILLMWLASLAVLIFQKDLGTTLLFFGLFVMMLYVATERPSWALLGTVLFLGGAALGYRFFGHVRVRVEAWLNPFGDLDQNYQIIQAQFGFAWGGLFGTGWGLGRPNLTPLAKNDFIAAALGEELGVTGLMAIIMIYTLIVARGLRAALAAREPFGKLLAAGLSFVFAIQVFAIIGGVTRLLPLTGLTTPFLSQGGSSLIANWMMLAVLLTITHQVRQPVNQLPAAPVTSLAHDTTQVIAYPSRTASATPDSPSSVDAAQPMPDDAAELGRPVVAANDEPTQAVIAAANDRTQAVIATPNDRTQAVAAVTDDPTRPGVAAHDEPTQAVPRPASPVGDHAFTIGPDATTAPPDEDDTNPRGARP